VRIGKTPPRSTKKKMGSKCESTPSPENTGRSEAFQKLMRNRWDINRTLAIKVIQNFLFPLARRQYVSPRFFFALASEKLQVTPDPVHAARLAAERGQPVDSDLRRQTQSHLPEFG
jgi:hypothetical protein